jgi:hypothetical protein
VAFRHAAPSVSRSTTQDEVAAVTMQNSTSSADHLRMHTSNWPMTKSRLGLPYGWSWARRVFAAIALAFGAIALAFGMGWLPPAYANHEDQLITIGCGIGFAIFGGLYVLLLPQQLANRPFPHAADDVLPNVPREPLLVPNQYANGAVTHELNQTPSGIVLRPRDNPYGWMPWFAYLWPLFTAAVMITIVSFANISLFWKMIISLTICLITATFVGIARLAFRAPPEGLAVVEIDQVRKTCVITRADESVTIDTDQIIAVQICAAYQKLEDVSRQQEECDNKQCRAEMELNLVWQNDEGTDLSADIERMTLMTLGWQFHELVLIARTLADTLGVPLLNHATPSHWRDERQRAKDRPYIAVGRTS